VIVCKNVEELCRQYHAYLIKVLTLRGIPHPDDILQAFYVYAIATGLLTKYDPTRGSFGNYVLKKLKWFAYAQTIKKPHLKTEELIDSPGCTDIEKEYEFKERFDRIVVYLTTYQSKTKVPILKMFMRWYEGKHIKHKYVVRIRQILRPLYL
jgi:hypothetical protein